MQLAAELVEGLSGMGRLYDAALVSLQHLRNTDAAAQLFCSAHEWRQASLSAVYPIACSAKHFRQISIIHLTVRADISSSNAWQWLPPRNSLMQQVLGVAEGH